MGICFLENKCPFLFPSGNPCYRPALFPPTYFPAGTSFAACGKNRSCCSLPVSPSIAAFLYSLYHIERHKECRYDHKDG
jgi:hypothetical protein